ncbi:hypothetical protein HDU89_005299 [Geranomyces variabilis]|nr:hypothetical protein HDU89_005299 [Geranomyces variabilis]
MTTPWTAQEKARLAHILRRHPNSWSIDSLLSDFPQKSYLQVAAFLGALRRKAPERFLREKVTSGENHRECDACEAEALCVLAPASGADVSIIRYPGLLRISHDSYMGEKSRPKLEANSARLLAASLRAWLTRVVPVVAAMATERHKLVASMFPATSPIVKVDENMVLAALRVVDQGCVPPLLSLRLCNDGTNEEGSNAEHSDTNSTHNSAILSSEAGAHQQADEAENSVNSDNATDILSDEESVVMDLD